MKEGWRWFGPSDAISLKEIRQTGATDVVTALYGRKCGEIWPLDEIKAVRDEVRKAGMVWSVVESVPVHESIKLRKGPYRKYIENYKRTLENIASCGIKTVCCNFMPVTDWVRSNLSKKLPDGSSVLQYNDTEIAMFDILMLKRPGAAKDYSSDVKRQAKEKFAKLSAAAKEKISRTILLGLPGTVDDLTVEQFREQLKIYEDVTDKKLRNNMYKFLNEIGPVCDKLDVKIAIHPDDPPRPIFGLPRVMSNAADFRELCEKVSSENIGFAFCTGSLGGDPENDETAMFAEFAPRIHFVHFRNVVYTSGRTFHESECHLTGKVNMPRLMELLLDEEARRKECIVVRPDHGRFMEIDKTRNCYPGYSYGGRLVGLAELRGLEYGLRYARKYGFKTAGESPAKHNRKER